MGRISTAIKRKNLIINGDMSIAQRGTSFAAIAAGAYSLDRWKYQKTGAAVHTLTQDTDVPTVAQSGYAFQNSLRLNLTTPDTSIAAGDFSMVQHLIEGYNWATLYQKGFTISFWVKATATGTYTIGLQNTGVDRYYIAEYTINTTATWEYKTIAVPAAPASGSWNFTNGIGLYIQWVLAAGSTFQSTANVWNTGNFFSTSNQVNGTNTGATDFRITGVMVNEGASAQPFQTYSNGGVEDELSACQRYYEALATPTIPIYSNTTTAGQGSVPFKVSKRTSAWTLLTSASYLTNTRIGGNSANSVTSVSKNQAQDSALSVAFGFPVGVVNAAMTVVSLGASDFLAADAEL